MMTRPITRPAPMTAERAKELVELMKREATIKSQKGLLHFALFRHGNLSDAARAVYLARYDGLCAAKKAA